MSKKGFTLIETLVAIAILVAAVVGPLGLAANGLFAAFAARDQAVASFLAQDAMEYIRYVRDNNILTGTTPVLTAGGLDVCLGADGCRVDSLKRTVVACGGQCDVLLFDDASGEYSYTTGTPTSFRRTIHFTELNPDEMQVEVQVELQTRTFTRSFTVREIMYNWPHL